METNINSGREQIECGLKLTIGEIVNSDAECHGRWIEALKKYISRISSESGHASGGDSVSSSQVKAWKDCFGFLAENLREIDVRDRSFDMIFEYSFPGTAHKRPDILFLTKDKVVCLEFKMKRSPQMDEDRDDVLQALRYKEWIQNHHEVTKAGNLHVHTYLVCTEPGATSGVIRGVEVLTADNFLEKIKAELKGEKPYLNSDVWVSSPKTEMPDMLSAISCLYGEGKIPYMQDVNADCLKKIEETIDLARKKQGKYLIFIDGVPGAGKTAVGQALVFEENEKQNIDKGKDDYKPEAVYLSGNGPLVDVLQYQINNALRKEGNEREGDAIDAVKNPAENAIQRMKDFKSYFDSDKIPEQPVLVFDEGQRAWDEKKMNFGPNRQRQSEPHELLSLGDRIHGDRGYAVIVVLYGLGQWIHDGEEKGVGLWLDALRLHKGWVVAASKEIAEEIEGLDGHDVKWRKTVRPWCHLDKSLRADFIDVSPWVESAISIEGKAGRKPADLLAEINENTSMLISVTYSLETASRRAEKIKELYPDWKYGIIISNLADDRAVKKIKRDWDVSYNGRNIVGKEDLGPWVSGNCKELDKVCDVFNIQGLELDCPIVLFTGEYIREGGRWSPKGHRYKYASKKGKYTNPELLMENNFRVLLTRARREMILVIPKEIPELKETYDYFIDMGMNNLDEEMRVNGLN